MTFSFERDLDRYSTVMADALKFVAEDLRTIDVVDLVSYVRFGSFATLEDLVHSSTELFFRHGVLSFAWTAAVDMTWNEAPTFTVGMEFRHQAVSVFFDLVLRARDEAVEIAGILFDDPLADPHDKVERLRQAIADARLPERSSCPPIARLRPRGGPQH